jgi:very-short-patch-repair endonuclease
MDFRLEAIRSANRKRRWKRKRLGDLPQKTEAKLARAETPAEGVMKAILNFIKVHFSFQKSFFFPEGFPRFYVVDFDLPRYSLIIEVDGRQHQEDRQRDYDNVRSYRLKKYCYRDVLRFTNDQVLFTPQKVLDRIEWEMEHRRT